ncbi:hypothetical protein V6N12_037413 [Hibiscus sabdariffa]
MRAASIMNHKNITVISGYHQCESGTILVFPLQQGTALDRYIWGEYSCSEKRDLKFEVRLKIAIAIAQGVRYMHEECPQWPVVHGELQPHNIFIRRDLQPMISGFGNATWLHNEELSLNSKNGCLIDPLDHETMELVKSDVLSFGVLLLRLFCRTSAPEDDKSLIEWVSSLSVSFIISFSLEILRFLARSRALFRPYRAMTWLHLATAGPAFDAEKKIL